MVSIKDCLKMIGISVVGFCGVFICTLFLNYYLDLQLIEDQIVSIEQQKFFDAQAMACKVVCCTSGGCLLVTSVILLIFYIKHYIDTHQKELGILKALGYNNRHISVRFSAFGLSLLVGTAIGYIAGFITMPEYYRVQNKDSIIPEVSIHFHLGLMLLIVVVPAVVFALLSMCISLRQLRVPALRLIRGSSTFKVKKMKDKENISFLKGLEISTVKQRKSLVFFIAFGSFCFSAMTQMSASMDEIASKMMSYMLMGIGYTMAFTSLLLAMTSVMKANRKTATMMRVFGYSKKECEKAVFGGYRIWNYLGFAVGSVYQYILLKVVVAFVFKDMENVPEYSFDFKVCFITLIAYIIIYEAAMKIYGKYLSKMSVKEIMIE